MKNEIIEKTVELYKIKSELSETIANLMDKEFIGIEYRYKNYRYGLMYNSPTYKTPHIDNEEIKRIVLGMLKSKLFDIETELKNLQC